MYLRWAVPYGLALVFVMLLPLGFGQSQFTPATLRGTVSTAGGLSASGAVVLVHNAGQRVDQTIPVGPDGRFQIGNLAAGRYQLTASKKGFINSSATWVELAPDRHAI